MFLRVMAFAWPAVSLAACGPPTDLGAIGAAVVTGIADALDCSGAFTGEGTLTSGDAACPATTSFEISTLGDAGVSPPGCSPQAADSQSSPCQWKCVDASGETRSLRFGVSEDASVDGVLTVVTSGDGGDTLTCVYHWSSQPR